MKWFFILAVVAAIALGGGNSNAMDGAFSSKFSPEESDDGKPSYIFVGGEYSSPEHSFAAVVGGATKIRGAVWGLARGVVGDYGSVETDVAVVFNFPDQRLDIGLVAGPGVNWRSMDEGDPVSYIIGTAGFFVGWRPHALGLYIGGKHRFDFSRDQGDYDDGFVLGAWMALGVNLPGS